MICATTCASGSRRGRSSSSSRRALKADGDPTLLRLVLQNLLGNAAKFSAKSRDARVEFGCKEARRISRVFRARQRRRLRYALRRKNVRHVSATAQRQRISRHRRRPRDGAKDHSAPRRPRMGRSSAGTGRRPRGDVLLHVVGEGVRRLIAIATSKPPRTAYIERLASAGALLQADR